MDSLLRQLNPMHTLTHYVRYVFNIILDYVYVSQMIPSPLFFSINAVYAFLNSKKCNLVLFRPSSGRKQQKCTNIRLTSRKSNPVESNSEYSAKAWHDFVWRFIAFFHATLVIRTQLICISQQVSSSFSLCISPHIFSFATLLQNVAPPQVQFHVILRR